MRGPGSTVLCDRVQPTVGLGVITIFFQGSFLEPPVARILELSWYRHDSLQEAWLALAIVTTRKKQC